MLWIAMGGDHESQNEALPNSMLSYGRCIYLCTLSASAAGLERGGVK